MDSDRFITRGSSTLHSPKLKVTTNHSSGLWSRGNEIHHSGIWRRDQRTRREGRSTNRISVRGWIGTVKKCSRSQEKNQRERMVSTRPPRGFPDLISEDFQSKLRFKTQTSIIPFFPINQKHPQSQCPVKKCIQVSWEWINTRKEFGRNWKKWLLKWIISIRDILD